MHTGGPVHTRGQLEVLEFHNTELQVELQACRQQLTASQATVGDLRAQLQQLAAARSNTDTLCTLRTLSAALARGEPGELQTWHRAVELLRTQLESTVCMQANMLVSLMGIAFSFLSCFPVPSPQASAMLIVAPCVSCPR